MKPIWLLIIGLSLIAQAVLMTNLLYSHHILVPGPLFAISLFGFPVGLVVSVVGLASLLKGKTK
jgi:hypothetical protein